MSEENTRLERKQEAAKAVVEKAQEAAAEIYNIYKPQWDSRADVLKTIVSLSSASIVLSVTFSSSLRALNIDLFWRRITAFSFALLALSLIVAFVALWVGKRLYEFQSNLLDKRTEIRKALLDASSKEDFDKSYQGILNRLHTPMERSDKTASWLFKISAGCFLLAVVLLAVIGIVQFLS